MKLIKEKNYNDYLSISISVTSFSMRISRKVL